MDVLMDLNSLEPGCSRSLLKEFFPAGLDIPDDRGENDWWDEKDRKDKEANMISKEQDRYNKDRYRGDNCGKRYDKLEVEEPGMPSLGKKWGGLSRAPALQ
jgi:hypothetical protein